MSLDFEHFMGTNTIPQGAVFHPNGQKYIFAAGACVIIADLIDPHEQQFLRYHDEYVNCLALSNSGRYVASGQLGEHADVIIYDVQTQSILYRCEEHDHGIQAVAFSEDEKIFVTIGIADDNNMIFWDMSNGCIIASSNKIPHQTKSVSFVGMVKDIKRRDTHHYQICTAGADGLTLWHLEPYTGDLLPHKVTGDPRGTISRSVTSLHYTPDREYIYAATSSGDFLICNVKSLRIVGSIVATKMSLNCILIHQGQVYIGCSDKTIKIYTLQGDFVKAINMDGGVLSLSLSSDQLELLALTSFGSICRVNIQNTQSIVLSEAHTGAVLFVTFDRGDPDRIASISADHTIKVWDLSDYAVISTAFSRREQEAGATPWCLTFHNLLFSGWSDGKILAHSAETGESLWLLDNAHIGGVSALTLSHNKRFLLSGAVSGDVRLWELRTRELVSHLKEHKQKVSSVKLKADDTVCLTGSRDRCILTWDLRNEKRVQCHIQRMGGINDFVLSRCEQFIISVGQDRRMCIWSARQGELLTGVNIDGENDEAMAIDISYDGEYVVTGGTAGMLRLWRLVLSPTPSLQIVFEARAHSKSITAVQFGAHDKQVVSAGLDGCIFCWWFNK